MTKIIFRCCLAIVDLLSPGFHWNLDAKFLVDGENDVEEIEAVDSKIINSMTVRLDFLHAESRWCRI